MVAHPDDESFGLGAILDRFVTTGARASVLCFTHGEASTLHGVVGDLREIRTTELAEAAGRTLGLDVLAWTLPDDVAGHLNAEFGTAFAGRPDDAASLRIRVDRQRQLQAIRAHPSHVGPGSVLWRRLELLGDTEQLTWLLCHRP